MPSAKRALARPQRGSPQSVASSGRSASGPSPSFALYRRARRVHERRLREATDELTRAAVSGEGYGDAAKAVFDACLPAVPYVPAVAILASEKAKLAARDGEPRRVGLVVDAAGSMHGVTHTIERIREHGVPGYDVEVIGTDPRVDRRLPAVAEVEVRTDLGGGDGPARAGIRPRAPRGERGRRRTAATRQRGAAGRQARAGCAGRLNARSRVHIPLTAQGAGGLA